MILEAASEFKLPKVAKNTNHCIGGTMNVREQFKKRMKQEENA
jgi:hypothetical protein